MSKDEDKKLGKLVEAAVSRRADAPDFNRLMAEEERNDGAESDGDSEERTFGAKLAESLGENGRRMLKRAAAASDKPDEKAAREIIESAVDHARRADQLNADAPADVACLIQAKLEDDFSGPDLSENDVVAAVKGRRSDENAGDGEVEELTEDAVTRAIKG